MGALPVAAVCVGQGLEAAVRRHLHADLAEVVDGDHAQLSGTWMA
jgi:hypothetical protein